TATMILETIDSRAPARAAAPSHPGRRSEMARIRIEQLARPEEEDLSGSQAGQVVGAGPLYYMPSPFFGYYGGVTTITPFYGTLGPSPYGYGSIYGGVPINNTFAFGPLGLTTARIPGGLGPVPPTITIVP